MAEHFISYKFMEKMMEVWKMQFREGEAPPFSECECVSCIDRTDTDYISCLQMFDAYNYNGDCLAYK